MLIIGRSLEDLFGLSQPPMLRHLDNLGWVQRSSAEVDRDRILANFGFIIFKEASRLGLPVQVRLFVPGGFPEVNRGELNKSASTDIDERVLKQLLIDSTTPEDINIDRELMYDVLEGAIENLDEAPELRGGPIDPMSTIAPDGGEEPPPAAPKAALSVEEQRSEMVTDLRKRLAAETKAVKREHLKYTRTSRANKQQDEEICDLREQITNLLSRVTSSPGTEAPHRSESVLLEAADVASMVLNEVVQNLTKLPDNRS
jgi:hypothetical protein